MTRASAALGEPLAGALAFADSHSDLFWDWLAVGEARADALRELENERKAKQRRR